MNVAMNLAKFKSTSRGTDIDLLDITRENIEFGEDAETTSRAKAQEEFEVLCSFIKDILRDKVEKVVVSSRLDSSPCVLVTSKFGWSANMERIMKAQAGADARAYEYMRGRRSLEINPNNRVIQNLLKEVKKDKENIKIRDAAEFMYQTALLTSGFDLEDPQAFGDLVYNLIERSIATQD